MPNKVMKSSFNSGELSEYMAGRTDVTKYHNGCSKLINATVLPHGGVTKRSGTEYIAKSPSKCKLFPFEFSVADSLVLEFSNLLIRFYKDGDRVFETAKTITGATQANPVVVTSNAHGYSDGDWVKITDVVGMTELNGKEYIVANKAANTFEITDTEGVDIDGTGYTVYGSAGDSEKVYEIVSPYTSAEAFDIHTTQSADVMYIAHEDHRPQKLSRTSDTDWAIADIDFIGGPFLDENTDEDDLIKITGSTITGDTSDTVFVDTAQSWETNELAGYDFYNITNNATLDIVSNTADTVTLSGAGLAANIVGDEYVIVKAGYYIPAGMKNLTMTATGHTPFVGTSVDVETQWQLSHTRADNEMKVEDGLVTVGDSTVGIRVLGDYNVDGSDFTTGDTLIIERKKGNGEWQVYRKFTAAVAFSATEEEDDVFYRISVDGGVTIDATLVARDQDWKGVAEVTTHSSTTVAKVTAKTDLYWVGDVATNDSETSMWSEGAWGEYRGYPRTLVFYEDRLWFASSTNNPDTLWGSKSSQYENFSYSPLGLDNESITAPIQDNEISQVQWMQARQVMAVGAANKEYRFGASDPDKPVTPSDRKSTPQTSFGSDSIQPVVLNDAIFFFQRQGRKLRAMKFDAIQENFQSDDATMLANTILESQPTCMAVQRVPDSILWIVRTDGTLLSFTYEPDEEIAGWARHLTQNSASIEQPTAFFESVTVIHGSVEDEVWVSIQRVINGNTVRYIERFATRFFNQIDEAVMVDSSLVVESPYEAQNIGFVSYELSWDDGGFDEGVWF